MYCGFSSLMLVSYVHCVHFVVSGFGWVGVLNGVVTPPVLETTLQATSQTNKDMGGNPKHLLHLEH